MGRPSNHFTLLPPSLLEDEEAVKAWMRRGLSFARTMPPKVGKARRTRRKRR